jgi:hypothetical protein
MKELSSVGQTLNELGETRSDTTSLGTEPSAPSSQYRLLLLVVVVVVVVEVVMVVGKAEAYCLRHYATSRKIAGSRPDERSQKIMFLGSITGPGV